MIRVDLLQAKPGMILSLPVSHPQRPGRPLLKAGFVLDVSTIRRLKELGQREVWIQYPGLEMIGRYISPKIMRAKQDLTGAIEKVLDGFRSGAITRLHWNQFREMVTGLVDALVDDPSAAIFIDDLNKSPNRMLDHAANVCFLSTIMGLKLQGYLVRQRRRLTPTHATNLVTLGVGAMFHDIGMNRLDSTALERWSEEHDESDPAWQRHVQLGYDLVTGRIEPSAAAVILNHHQYFDGSGFPRKADWENKLVGMHGDQIHVFARIVTVADQYDELRYFDPDRKWPTVRTLRALTGGAMQRRMDPVCLRTLLEIVPAFSPGSPVKLSTGEQAFVIDWQPSDPCRPRVAVIGDISDARELSTESGGPAQPERRVIDLSRERDKSIVEAEHIDVRNDLFNLPIELIPSGGIGLIHALEAA